MIAVAIALVQVAGASWMPTTPPAPVQPATAKAAVIACGAADPDVTTAEDAELQETVIRIRSRTRPTAGQLSCIAAASIRTGYYVQFAQAADQQAYDPVYFRQAHDQSRRNSRAALANHGLLDSLPTYDPKRQSLLAFAGGLETLCGIAPGSVLTLASPALLTLKLDVLPMLAEDRLWCLLTAADASNLEEQGSGIGFIGNEAAGPQVAPPHRRAR